MSGLDDLTVEISEFLPSVGAPKTFVCHKTVVSRNANAKIKGGSIVSKGSKQTAAMQMPGIPVSITKL